MTLTDSLLPNGNIAPALEKAKVTDKDHEELYKTNKDFKDKARKECLWDRFASSSNLSVQYLVRIPKESLQKTHTVQVWPGSQGNDRGRTRLRINLTSSRHTSDTRDSANLQPSSPQPEEPVHLLPHHTTSPAVLTRCKMEISMRSDTTLQPSVTSSSVVSQCSTVNQQVMNQFARMKTR